MTAEREKQKTKKKIEEEEGGGREIFSCRHALSGERGIAEANGSDMTTTAAAAAEVCHVENRRVCLRHNSCWRTSTYKFRGK